MYGEDAFAEYANLVIDVSAMTDSLKHISKN